MYHVWYTISSCHLLAACTAANATYCVLLRCVRMAVLCMYSGMAVLFVPIANSPSSKEQGSGGGDDGGGGGVVVCWRGGGGDGGGGGGG